MNTIASNAEGPSSNGGVAHIGVPAANHRKNRAAAHHVLLWAGILMLAATSAWAAPSAKTPDESTQSIVPVFRLNGPVTEQGGGEDFPLFASRGTSLKELVERLEKAANDPAVKAVVIEPEGASPGTAQMEELRAAMALVRNGGKEVYVYADSLIMGQYLLACGASRISVVPTGLILIPGLHGSSLHVRGLLDKIGVKPDFLTEGAYKSAAELFMRDQPSPEADEMMNWLLDSYYSSFTDLIATGRKVDAAKVRDWLDSGLFTAEQAKAAGLIDAVEQHADFKLMLEGRYGKAVRVRQEIRPQRPTGNGFLVTARAFQDLGRNPARAPEENLSQAGRRNRLCERPDHLRGIRPPACSEEAWARSAPKCARRSKRRRTTIPSRPSCCE